VERNFFSDTFRVLNGVKQGGIISPVLFCIYFYVLLTRLREADIGCHLGHWFVGALAYADDIVILAPTANAARRMLDTCDVFASEYCVQFDASKSKCIHFYTGKSSRSAHTLKIAYWLRVKEIYSKAHACCKYTN
jgi:Reverse transcriptase (RNA-dependent DNA polymerase)